MFTVGCIFLIISHIANELNVDVWRNPENETIDWACAIANVIGGALVIASILTLTWRYLP